MCIMSQKVGDVAKKTNMPRLQGSTNVLIALDVMDIYGVGLVAVECEDDFSGVFSRSDFIKNVIRQNLDPADTTLYEVIRLDTPFVDCDMTVKDAYEKMLLSQWGYMPVLDGRKLCGIVSMRDLGRDVMKSFEDAKSENEMILNYIQGGEFYAMASYES